MTRAASPLNRVMAAMPGTLAELRERTGYPTATILQMIGQLRAGGTPTFAWPDGETGTVFFTLVPERTTASAGPIDGPDETVVP